LSKVPPRSPKGPDPRQRPPKQRSTERPRSVKIASKGQVGHADGDAAIFGAEGVHEADMTHHELVREAEKYSEGWLKATDRDEHEDKKEMEDERLKEERVNQKDDVHKPGEKEKSKDNSSSHKQATAETKHQKIKDGFQRKDDPLKASVEKLEKAQAAISATPAGQKPPPPRVSGRPDDPMTILHSAQPPGVYFKEGWAGGGQGQEEEDPDAKELAEAIEEAIRLLAEVGGITRIGPGRSETDEPVVLVLTGKGFGEKQFKMVPENVRRFATLVVIPYDLLPLKRERLI
jgi:hypothetical protein